MEVVKSEILILNVIIIGLSVIGTNTVLGLNDNQHESAINTSEKIEVQNQTELSLKDQNIKRDDDPHKASYILNGFVENGSIPVNFPKDICLFHLEGVLHASVLHLSDHPHSKSNQTILLTIFKKQNSGEYLEIFKYNTRNATDMDCVSMDGKGFVAISNTIENDKADLSEASPIFEITGSNVVVVQYFIMPLQKRVYLRKHGNHLYFVQSIFNTHNRPSLCPIFKWSRYHFDLLDELPCTKAMQIEPFSIGSNIFIAVANNKDELEETETFSFIYKYSVEHKKFLLHQKIRTNAAVDVQYFKIKDENFLVFANSYEKQNDGVNHETVSVIYKLTGDQFTPFQSIMLYDAIQFQPVSGPNNEFILLISCNKQATQAWQYNGWLFYKSEVQFTGGALGQGVSKMRSYLLDGSPAVVIANPYVLKEANNIFFPQFVLIKNSNVVDQAIESWCTKNSVGMQTIADAKTMAVELDKLPKRNHAELTNFDNIHFQEVAIDEITTQSMQLKSLVLNKEFASKIVSMNNLIEDLEERIKNLESNLASSDKQPLTENKLQQESQMNNLTEEIPESLNFNELTIGEEIDIKFINDQPFENLLFKNRDLNISQVRVNELIMNDYESYKEIIGKATMISDEDLSRVPRSTFVVPTSGVVDTLTLDSLLIDGFINNLDLSILNASALKLQGDQVLESDINFHFLEAASLQTSSLISKRFISDIVRTVGGPYVVNKTIRFATPVVINNFIVQQRINNINVDTEGGLDILLKRSTRDQVMKGLKIFEQVKLESPIVLQGKIKKSNLNQINPIVSFSDDIVLEGDYELKGNTTVVRLLRGENIYGKSEEYNVKDLLSNGIHLSTPVIEPIFEFIQPVKTKNLISKSVNNVDVSKFVRTDEIQKVNGRKSFTGDLHINNGYCDAMVINDIDLSVLNSTILKTSGRQIVEGKIHFNKIVSRPLSSTTKNVTLFGRKYFDYLTKTDQVIHGNVTIQGNLIVNNIQIENLRSKSTISEYDLENIIADTITTTMDSRSSIVTGEKFFRNHLIINNLQVAGNIFQLGTMKSILSYWNLVTQEVVLTGPITFNDLLVNKFDFTNSINGIPSQDFGTQWMLSETNQDFTAPQSILSIRTIEDVILNGTFNNLELGKQFEFTQFKDQPIAFKNVTFVKVVFQQPITIGGLVSGIKFPNDVFLRDADFPQSLAEHVTFTNLNISGSISLLEKLNNIDYNIACDLISPELSPYGLILTHDAKFDIIPQIQKLNGWDLNQLYNEVWMTNVNTVVTGTPTFADIQFTQPLEIKGLFNGKDVSHIAKDYVSLTKNQQIISAVEIQGNVLYQENIRVGNVQLQGFIKDTISGSSIRIEEFNQNVLKHDVEQVITGQWDISEAHIYGDLITLVNGLNLALDVVRFSIPLNNVTAAKSFESISVNNLNCYNGCKMMDVDIGQWIGRVVLNGANYTIQGTTVIDSPVIFNNINVLGIVNNVTFSSDNILQRTLRQKINGNVHIFNQLSDKRILPLSFEHVHVELINGKNLSELYLNVVYKDDPLTVINTRLEFKEPLSVENIQLLTDFGGVNVNGLIQQMQMYQVFTNHNEQLQHMNVIGSSIIETMKIKHSFLDTYRLKQVIFGTFKKMVCVEVTTPVERFDVIVLLNATDINGFLNFYVFHRETSVLTLDTGLFGIKTKDMYILDIFSITISDRDFLIVQTRNHFSGAVKHSFFTYLRGQFRNVYEMHGNESKEILKLNMGNDDCLITFATGAANAAISCAFFVKPESIGFQPAGELHSSAGIVQVCSITSANRVEIAILDVEGKISIWSMNAQRQFVRSQIIKTLHMTTHITIAHHKGFNYIAACSETSPTGVHLGTIEIFISSASKYVSTQSIVLESPSRSELSVVSSTNDLVLYVLTNGITKPLIVYRYTGITKFKEFTTGVTLPLVHRINILKTKVLGKELISLFNDGVGAIIIEADVR